MPSLKVIIYMTLSTLNAVLAIVSGLLLWPLVIFGSLWDVSSWVILLSDRKITQKLSMNMHRLMLLVIWTTGLWMWGILDAPFKFQSAGLISYTIPFSVIAWNRTGSLNSIVTHFYASGGIMTLAGLASILQTGFSFDAAAAIWYGITTIAIGVNYVVTSTRQVLAYLMTAGVLICSILKLLM